MVKNTVVSIFVEHLRKVERGQSLLKVCVLKRKCIYNLLPVVVFSIVEVSFSFVASVISNYQVKRRISKTGSKLKTAKRKDFAQICLRKKRLKILKID